MTLEQQVCSLELAKRLKELGVKQESAEYWHNYNGEWLLNSNKPRKEVISAFSVAELGEMLPYSIEGEDGTWTIEQDRFQGLWLCYYAAPLFSEKDLHYDDTGFSDTEANARAEMLVYLLENNLLRKE